MTRSKGIRSDVYLDVQRDNIIISLFKIHLITLIVYFLSIWLLGDVIIVSAINLEFVKNVAIIVLFSWGPLHAMKLIRMKMDPTEN